MQHRRHDPLRHNMPLLHHDPLRHNTPLLHRDPLRHNMPLLHRDPPRPRIQHRRKKNINSGTTDSRPTRTGLCHP
jgi:hypothetical protein